MRLVTERSRGGRDSLGGRPSRSGKHADNERIHAGRRRGESTTNTDGCSATASRTQEPPHWSAQS